ncbi:hypothetical protein [Pseudoalteromonas sp. APC 3218]|uniref:hypothetical protein n=1 Tax=Pseudoalteromonas sp. APC 3218 TaxID=3035180 RepID=UPI0025B338FA|nr:hypothetical protein [Pseudoalteromonas sp. APC 3218]MDN3404202.1 hypothetical protein [Pseudoalteromonas sp. APC 3218]
MNDAAQVIEQLEELVKSTNSPVYAVCTQIVSYLRHNPNQRNLTIGGLRAALDRNSNEDKALIEGAFTLVSYPFQVLEVRYKLYDEQKNDVLEELNHPTYMQAISAKEFIDDDGNNLSIDDLNARVYPYFINLINDEGESVHGEARS